MLDKIPSAQPDPIISLSNSFNQDARSQKIDLGIGVYKNNLGITPIMQAVKTAQLHLAKNQTTKSYIGLSGRENFNQLITHLLLKNTQSYDRCSCIQTPGASGALRMLADLIYLAKPNSRVWLSDPSYVNHKPIMQAAGLNIQYYPYFDRTTKQVNISNILESLAKTKKDDIVLLHGCCHNPTGAELHFEHWQAISELAQKIGFIPFIDISYQGLGSGLEQDIQGLQILANSVEQMLIAQSCSKNFGLYRERTGAAIIIANNKRQAINAREKTLELVRKTYTMPPDHGAAIVETILTDKVLTNLWHQELNEMRNEMKKLRQHLKIALAKRFENNDFDFIENHQGMFSMLNLTASQMNILKTKFAIYALPDSRINIAGLKISQVDNFADAIFAVAKYK